MKKITAILCSFILLFLTIVQLQSVEAETNDESFIVVSLGDSYSSGEGVEPFYGQYGNGSLNSYIYNYDWLAHRSTKSWSGQLELKSSTGNLASQKDKTWFFVAASGATTDHLKNEQVKISTMYLPPIQTDVAEALPPQLSVFDKLGEGNKADFVTITIGGNDAHFSEIIELAAKTIYYRNPTVLIDRINQIWEEFYKTGGIRDKIKQAYYDIWYAAGDQVTIIVAGYPTLLDNTGRGPLFEQPEAQIINSAVLKFNIELQKLVRECQEEGIDIVFVPIDFTGHEAYSKDAWLTPVWILPQSQDLKHTLISRYSMHPNEKGLAKYTSSVQIVLEKCEEEKIAKMRSNFQTQDNSLGQQDNRSIWDAIDGSGLLNYVSMPYDRIKSTARTLQSVAWEPDAWLSYLYSFAEIDGIEFSFETYLPNPDEQMDRYGQIPASYALQYLKPNDRCDGMLVYSINAFGLSDINASDIGAEIFEFMPDTGLWMAHAEHAGCDFYFVCEDSDGSISDRCAVWIVGNLPPQEVQTPNVQKNGWINEGRSSETWTEGDWFYYTSGRPVTGWQSIDGETYFFFNNGKMAEGLTTINGALYYLMEHNYGGGPSTGNRPEHGALSNGGFEQRSDGSMVFCDLNGRVITYDGEGDSRYFEYATAGFSLVWNEDQLAYERTAADYGYYDIDKDGIKEFYIKRGTGEPNYSFEFYTPDSSEQRYNRIGTIDGAYSKLVREGDSLYLVNQQANTKQEIRIKNGIIELEATGSSQQPATESKASLTEKLLSNSLAKEIGMTYGELNAKYGPLDYVYLATEEPIQAVFTNSKGSVSYYFDGVADSIPNELWDESIANNGIISPNSAGKLIFDSDACTGVYATFRTFGISDPNYYETWFTKDNLYHDELWDMYHYTTSSGRYDLSTESETANTSLNGDDWLEITLKRGYWPDRIIPTQEEESKLTSKWHYDPYAALASAENVLNTIEGKGATYVSKLLREGGLTKVKQSGAGDLIDYLNNAKNWDGERIGTVVTDPAYSELHVGDVLCSVCSKGSKASDYTNGHGKGTNLYHGIQVFFVSEIGADYVCVYSKNNDRHNEVMRISCNGGNIIDKCGRCGNSDNVHWIAFVFDEAIKSEK